MSFAQWGNELYSGERSLKIVPRKELWLSIGGLLMIIAIVLLAVRGLNPSIDFTGGTQFIVTGGTTTDSALAEEVAAENSVSDVRVQSLGSDSVRIQTESLDSKETTAMREALAEAYGVDVGDVDANSIGATWGQDVTSKALQSIVIFVVLVAILMAVYFKSIRMSGAAMLSLVHDLLITAGFFALVQVEVSPSTVIGFLTILGYSLYDTVVVFDKVRELSRDYSEQHFHTYPELVNIAVNRTLVRSINTSIVALLPVAAILFIGSLLLGAGTLRDIALALFVGMLVGTFSSVFIASPALAWFSSNGKIKVHDREVLDKRAKVAAEKGIDEKALAGMATRQVIPGKRLANSEQPKRKKRK